MLRDGFDAIAWVATRVRSVVRRRNRLGQRWWRVKNVRVSHTGLAQNPYIFSNLPSNPSPQRVEPLLPSITRRKIKRPLRRNKASTTTHRPRPSWHIHPNKRIRIRRARRGPCGPLGRVIILQLVVERALVEMDGGLGCCWYDNCCECMCGREREDVGDGCEDVEWKCWGRGD